MSWRKNLRSMNLQSGIQVIASVCTFFIYFLPTNRIQSIKIQATLEQHLSFQPGKKMFAKETIWVMPWKVQWYKILFLRRLVYSLGSQPKKSLDQFHFTNNLIRLAMAYHLGKEFLRKKFSNYDLYLWMQNIPISINLHMQPIWLYNSICWSQFVINLNNC